MGISKRKVVGLLSAVGGIASWFGEHLIEHMIFERVGHVAEPLAEYAVPAFFVAICFWGFWPEKFHIGHGQPADHEPSIAPNPKPDHVPEQPEFIGMEAAARKAYAEARRVDSFWAHFVETSEATHSVGTDPSRDDRILCDIANLIAGEIAIYGEASPSPTRELIAKAKDSTACRFFDSGNTLRFLLFDKTVYRNICVKSNELDAVVASLDSRLKTTTII